MITYKNYTHEDYETVCDFLIAVNQENKDFIHWNWARFEWMYDHPFTKKELLGHIRLWYDNNKVIAVTLFDMYFGEACCVVLPSYKEIYSEVLEYAYDALKDEQGLKISISDNNKEMIDAAIKAGYVLDSQTETVLRFDLDKDLDINLPKGLSFVSLDPRKEPYEYQWLLWRGFDHGSDKEEFEEDLITDPTNKNFRDHFNADLSIAIKNEEGDYVAYCSVWYSSKTDYAYVEPVCVIPSYRGKGVGKAVVLEALRRVKELGAKKAYILSDMDFYKKIGFIYDSHFTFYNKRNSVTVKDKTYQIIDLIGKGKGGYSYLATCDNQRVVVKVIHHEPCDYYQFGNKIESEKNDYQRLVNAGIRVPRLIAIDLEQEMIIKEYIDGPIVSDLVKENKLDDKYIEQVRLIAEQAQKAGLNIDYYPTNFVVQDGKLYYVDYECNNYMDEWSFENWGIKYWSKTPEFIQAFMKEEEK